MLFGRVVLFLWSLLICMRISLSMVLLKCALCVYIDLFKTSHGLTKKKKKVMCLKLHNDVCVFGFYSKDIVS